MFSPAWVILRPGFCLPAAIDGELQQHRSLQQVIEVIVRDHRNQHLAGLKPRHGKAFHIVDLIAEVGFDQRFAFGSSSGFQLIGR